MKVLICGGRDYDEWPELFRVMDDLRAAEGVTLLIEGGAKGADRAAYCWATSRGVSTQRFEADWSAYGPAAGPIRNQRMLAEGKPDLVIAFAGGRGTDNMISQAEKAGVPVRRVA